MASALFGLSRALAARSAGTVPRSVVRARAAPLVRAPAFVAGVRFYLREELDRRLRTLLIHNVPFEMTLEEVQQELQPFRGFVSVEPVEDRDGSFRILFTDKAARIHARRVFLRISWQGRHIIPISEYTEEEPPEPSRRVYVAGVPRHATTAQLNEFFAGVEGCERIKVPKSKMWTGYIGYAAMTFGTVEQATNAIELLKDRWVGESKAWVNYSRRLPLDVKKARVADRVKNPKKEEEAPPVLTEEEKKAEKIKQLAAAARARRKAWEEEQAAKEAGDAGLGYWESLEEKRQARARMLNRGRRRGRERRPEPDAQMKGMAYARVDEPATPHPADAPEVVSAIKGDSTYKPSGLRDAPSDALAAQAAAEMAVEADEADEAADRIAAARARRQAREKAQEAAGEVTDTPGQTKPSMEETAEAKEKSSEA